MRTRYDRTAVQRIRVAKKLSVEVLAKLSGVSQRGLYQIDRGQSEPLADSLGRIAEALGVPVASFYHRVR